MSNFISEWIIEKVSLWLLQETPPKRGYLSDFNRVCQEIQRADILLVEGRSRASLIIKHVTQSPWSHAALYIGRVTDITDPTYRRIIERNSKYPPDTQLLIESEIGLGTMVSPVDKYRYDHVRILRPHGLRKTSIPDIINYAISRIGRSYDLRHLLDLMRFMFPWGLLPRRWRSSLFQHNALQPTKDICSTMIANAFHSVHFPILPVIRKNEAKEIELIERNVNLFTPCDFDYSPFFDVVKYPILPLDAQGEYKNLNWRSGVIGDDEEIKE
ncbi:MAG TPA: YiiX/YebB-like N1pC/P60 family cysteine hydrolase [Gammaproteobacteria bacterium]|nr:YiiX/YebB-like N1pC/P60 family cysteine hydrolase [Gammaproteobacteria bacterium]